MKVWEELQSYGSALQVMLHIIILISFSAQLMYECSFQQVCKHLSVGLTNLNWELARQPYIMGTVKLYFAYI